ncbi:18K peptidoglycan-associated outer membrane lipoprotein; Peptidoglycan-associated lipoprotein precursor; Outer membrane protein P6; OmpA/MotB precursor [Rubrivivax sp. A210]|uniref:OmpA family protein n=1 Tax=Rubrivivax sp. A210 TaxID=2772301 RepID=UPI001983EDD4|nr:OmpA family protein [Rubrivivax sp. A210]CAD5371895.1 18K peptidoglycan-associated outer membrane lipoprotein; Peptidoglycan-associated lipoprotein precursor; Outer membrane protein P6; OmpA/MotB precursor [Rubrivivax sp. A210]
MRDASGFARGAGGAGRAGAGDAHLRHHDLGHARGRCGGCHCGGRAAAGAQHHACGTAGASQATPPTAAPAAAPAAALPAAAAESQLARRVYFDFDRYAIDEDYVPMLLAHGRALADEPGRTLVVEGHADQRGGAEYNLALGQKRALAVVKALRQFGAAESQLEPVSFGDKRPLALGDTEEAWARNRRVELKPR